MKGSWIKAFVTVQSDKVGDGLMSMIANWDPEGASEADLREMRGYLVTLSERVVKAERSAKKEQDEATAARAEYDKHKTAAILFSEQAAAATDEVQRAALRVKAEKLITFCEQHKAEVEREEREASEAVDFFNQLKELAELKARQLDTAEANIKDALRRKEKAEAKLELAEERREVSEELGNMSNGTGRLGTALQAFNKAAQAAEDAADAAVLQESLLSKVKKGDDLNALVAEAAGVPVNMDLSSRLAAI